MIQSLEESTVNDWKVVIRDAWTGEEIKSVDALHSKEMQDC